MASFWVTGVQKPVTVVWNYYFDERNTLLLINGTWIKAILKAVFMQIIQFVLTATLLLPVQYTLIWYRGAQLPQPALLHNRMSCFLKHKSARREMNWYRGCIYSNTSTLGGRAWDTGRHDLIGELMGENLCGAMCLCGQNSPSLKSHPHASVLNYLFLIHY